MQLKVNDQEVRLDHNIVHQLVDAQGMVLADIRMTRDGFFHVDSASHWIRITCDAREIIISSSPVHNGRLCGLCGTQTGRRSDDLVGPSKTSLPSHLMGVAYQLDQPEGCIQHIDDRRAGDRLIRDQPSVKLSVHTRHVASDDDCTLHRNKMIHRGNRRCFSINPLVKCSPTCRPAQLEQVNVSQLQTIGRS